METATFTQRNIPEVSHQASQLQDKSRKNVLAFFNHLDLPPAKVALMFFCQKLS